MPNGQPVAGKEQRPVIRCLPGEQVDDILQVHRLENGGDPGQYKYTVRIQGRSPVDPFVINR